MLLVGIRYELSKPVGTCDVTVTCWTVALQVVLQFILHQRFVSDGAPPHFLRPPCPFRTPVILTQSVETQISLVSQLHTTTASTTRQTPHAVINNIVLLTMDIMMPETC